MREFITFTLLGLAWFGMALTIIVLHDEKYAELRASLENDAPQQHEQRQTAQPPPQVGPTVADMNSMIPYTGPRPDAEKLRPIVRVEGRVLLDTPPIRPAALPPPIMEHRPVILPSSSLGLPSPEPFSPPPHQAIG